jgi:hypothetical protein
VFSSARLVNSGSRFSIRSFWKRDDHSVDDNALGEAKKTKQDLETRITRLDHLPEEVKSWWEKISVQRDLLQNKTHESNHAKRYIPMASIVYF